MKDIFLKNYCKKQNYHPKTIPTSLKSLEHFLHYIISEQSNDVIPTNDAESSRCFLVLRKSSLLKIPKLPQRFTCKKNDKPK